MRRVRHIASSSRSPTRNPSRFSAGRERSVAWRVASRRLEAIPTRIPSQGRSRPWIPCHSDAGGTLGAVQGPTAPARARRSPGAVRRRAGTECGWRPCGAVFRRPTADFGPKDPVADVWQETRPRRRPRDAPNGGSGDGEWCPGRDLNPDELPHTPLKRTRIPIPPPGQVHALVATGREG